MKRAPLYLQILIGMLAGGALGLILGPKASFLGELGKGIIQLIKTLAAPLLFFAILDAFLRTQIKARNGAIMLSISALNGVLATAFGLLISNVFRPGSYFTYSAGHAPAPPVAMHAPAKLSPLKAIFDHIPSSIVQPFTENAIISIILLALLFGLALRKLKNEQVKNGETAYRPIEDGVQTIFRAIEILLTWVIRFVPLAVFGVVAKAIGEQGLAPLKGLAAYLAAILFGLAVYIAIVYQAWILFVARRSLSKFWKDAKDAVVYALGASSSLATLPVTLRTLDRMGVSNESARLAACVGTNFNHDGIILYEAMAALFVAQAYGIHLNLGQQVLVAASAVLAGIGIAGVPDAGLISLSLVLATVDLPVEILPLLLTVDWVLSRARATTNVISDMTSAVVLDRFSKKGSKSGSGRV